MINNKPFIYNPAQKTKEQLITEFVVRKNVFEKLFNELKSAPRDLPPQHHLVAGQRGMGKTTLLLRLKYAIEDEPELKDFLIPVRFSEEQYNIVRLEHLWEETAELLEFKNPIYKGLQDEMQAHEEEENYERVCFEIFEKRLKLNNHRALLLIDNIGELLEKFPLIQNNRLREILMTSPYIQLIGCSSKVLEHTFHYDKPFFEFFNQIKLEPLDQASTVELLRALGKEYKQVEIIEDIIKNNPARIEVLRRITGGVPRTLILLFDIFIDNKEGTAFEDLQHLLDSVNSLYKHRMDELKPQQQQILDTLARAWDSISASEVLERSKLHREGIKSNQISAQLKQLSDNQIVETIVGEGKKQTYRIRERFFNIWYLMRHGRKQNKEEILWLIKFLEGWCTLKELETMAYKQMENMESGEFSETGAYLKTTALLYLPGISMDIKYKLGSKTEKYLREKGRLEWAERIKNLKSGFADTEIENKIWAAINTEDWDIAEKYLLQAIANGNVDAMFNLAFLYDEIKKDYNQAEKYYLNAIANGNVEAMNNLALFYQDIKKDYDQAEKYYLKAIEKGDKGATNNLALFYQKIKKDYDQTEKYYLQAIANGNVRAMNNLALFYIEIKKDYDQAEKFYLQAIANGQADAIYNLANFYREIKKDYDQAEKYYLKAVEKGDGDAMHNLILFYIERNKINDALAIAVKLFKIESYYNSIDRVIGILSNLLIHKQVNFLLNQFNQENSLLMKHASPFYYVLAYFMKDELPGVYEKAGSEIKETVDEIIKDIEDKMSKNIKPIKSKN